MQEIERRIGKLYDLIYSESGIDNWLGLRCIEHYGNATGDLSDVVEGSVGELQEQFGQIRRDVELIDLGIGEIISRHDWIIGEEEELEELNEENDVIGSCVYGGRRHQ